jgi:hypothetical protein
VATRQKKPRSNSLFDEDDKELLQSAGKAAASPAKSSAAAATTPASPASGSGLAKKAAALFDDDEWTTEPDFVNDVTEKEQRWGSKLAPPAKGKGIVPSAEKLREEVKQNANRAPTGAERAAEQVNQAKAAREAELKSDRAQASGGGGGGKGAAEGLDVDHEIRVLAKGIERLGGDQVRFGDLFADNQLAGQLEALAGTLRAAKKRGVVDFKGELLLQGSSDDVIVYLKDRSVLDGGGSAAPVKQQQQQQKPPQQKPPQQQQKQQQQPDEVPEKPAAAAAPKEPSSKGVGDVDLSQCTEAFNKLRASPGWALLSYDGLSLVPSEGEYETSGDAAVDIANLKAAITKRQDEVLYAYVHVLYGDTRRTKFVLFTYVPNGLSGMKKARANMHKPAVEAFVQYFHTMVQATSLNDISADVVMDKIRRAAGANYGGATSISSDYKDKALQSYIDKGM